MTQKINNKHRGNVQLVWSNFRLCAETKPNSMFYACVYDTDIFSVLWETKLKWDSFVYALKAFKPVFLNLLVVVTH